MLSQLERLHGQLAVREDTTTATIYSLRNWLAFRLIHAGDTPYLERAYHGAMVAHRLNEPNIRFLTLAIFMAAESNHFDVAEFMLDKAWGFRKFLMQNEPFYYGTLCFLRAFLALKQQKNRAAKRYRKAFTAYAQSTVYSPHYDVMEGQLYLAAQDYQSGYTFLVRGYANGCRNVYVHEGLYRCHKNGHILPDHHKILEYAAARGVNIVFHEPKDKIGEIKPITDMALTQFELTPPEGARYVFVSQPEKRGMEEYEFSSSAPLIIESVDNFSYICMGVGRREIISLPMQIRRLYPQATVEIYKQFYDRGDRRFQVLAYLSSSYLMNPTPDAIPVFIDILEEKNLPTPYRMKVLTTLGHLHEDGRAYYNQVDLSTLEGQDLAKILNVYLERQQYEIAAKIIENYYEIIPLQVVYNGLCVLPDHSGLCKVAYDLLIAGYNDNNLLSYTLEKYQASYAELVNLANALPSPDSRLDTQILTTSLWMHEYGLHAQLAFWRLHYANLDVEARAQFIELLIGAILSEDFVPEYETIKIMEESLQSEGFYLLMALNNLYLSHKITTMHSSRLITEGIQAQEERGILFSVFKEHKPYQHPYLEKYQPFLYKASPGRDIRLYYRINNEYKSIPMEYLAYGIYTAKLPLFYNETITYYYSEERETGSIATKEYTHKNTIPYLNENHPDKYFAINNALVYEQMFRHEAAHRIAEELVDSAVEVGGKIL